MLRSTIVVQLVDKLRSQRLLLEFIKKMFANRHLIDGRFK